MIRHGDAPFLECSTRGDSRFSAFRARIRRRGGRTIEEIYQAAKIFEDGSTGLSPKAAKGKAAVNQAEVHELYATLWDEYIDENPSLLDVIKASPGLQDMFGQRGHACQATELWRIRGRALGLDCRRDSPEKIDAGKTGDLFSDTEALPSASAFLRRS